MKLELSHDSLAKSIYDKFSAEDKMRAQIRQLLRERLIYYKDYQRLLTKDDLNYIDPYIDSIELGKEELNLVRESQQKIKRRKKQITSVVVGGIVLLTIFNLITRSLNGKNAVLLEEEEEEIKILAREDSLKKAAEMRADTLYQQLMAQNPEFTKELIASFDTLKSTKKVVEKERNIAQSATLSALGEAAMEQDDKNYAFRLAAKAWELNPENKLACELLYKISSNSNYDEDYQEEQVTQLSKKEHHTYIANLIAKERNENGRGRLDEQKMQLIFNQQNTVVQKKEEGVRKRIERYIE
ncbi:hypothetical protein [Aureispira sp. CCB-QB1]|uniref:hypothetical protein n=1 Tax=Aureispira sp. CCB-QB1 TaxID=1313421 RepID=UPI000695E9E5|nr:hypothetical protein [Aureispira sp. CCB-QB1]